ncbi:MAG: SIMPL domain-containing protein [Candidatus Nanoarchaeia archaeon]|nr:SIMPL domain-containing protein [Candidatus Nanoarchaeia archaeon]
MKNLNITIIIAVLLIVLGTLFGIYLLKNNSSNTISASGNYQMSVAPDQVIVYLLIETRSKSADDAKNKNSLISESVLNALSGIGIDKSTIQTENYNIYPEYDWNNGAQTLKDYVTSNNIKIKTNDFGKVGKIVDAAVNAGALVSYINFELTPEKNNQYKSQVLTEASKDAKVKAESIALGLGKKLGSLVSVSSQDYNYMPYPMYTRTDQAAGAMEVKSAVTNIQPKNLDVSASVSVVYNIK